ncbi:hypothetical protein [Cutibacterium avidum]|uniref:hypothetical protein n=1 Tax=Cutibacterium avidum TaxID=33010 RepID=UPI0002CCDB48|nr:hypothetical protein [Cutibacterium avidum]AGJ77192.1 hypothetical protein PALO_02885 [Cutibacterium avidum 44067]MCO6671946.1 hypothetical protein [Cutibacterium avidum]MDU5023007.1 hypothetical protein [Cutibacterium avidum]PGX68352.1 hypothetical protein B6N39_07830 [Cutibacterium avidum]PGX70518.1 hypothetical protein B6N38_05825 [Cutibacterium avidum]
MKTPADTRARRRLIAVIATGTALVVLVVFGVYGLLTGPNQAPTENAAPTPAAPASPAPSPGVSPTPSRPVVPPVRASRDPETFAGNATHALFTWDTTTGLMPLDYTAALLDVGDPTGTEQAGLAADIATYLPTREAWAKLRPYATTQTLTIDSIRVPDSWAQAVQQAHPGQLPEGATAYTIHGTRHRDGTWNGKRTSAERDVAFTVFIACPVGKDCYLLRLSGLDNPLN